jgi:OOP family OmpA-OmpF porin
MPGKTSTSFVAAVLVSAAIAGCKASAAASAGDPATPPSPPPPSSASAPPPVASAAPPAAPPPAPKAIKGDVKGSRINIPGNIVYDTAKATIKPESEPTLTQLNQFLVDNPQVTKLRIEGHTDSDGDDDVNMKLSGARAKAVAAWLVAKGISADRLLAVGFGEEKPLVPNTTKENKEQNRRTEFHIAQIDGKNFLGRDPTGGGTVF